MMTRFKYLKVVVSRYPMQVEIQVYQLGSVNNWQV
jgi:hypothetical protein